MSEPATASVESMAASDRGNRRRIGAVSANESTRALGACWIVYGILRLLGAALMMLMSGTATVMFGALLARVADPFSMMSVFHAVYIVLVVVAIAAGVTGILAGAALVAGGQQGRRLALVASLLSVSSLPLGTTLGIYTMILLLRPRAD